VSGGSDPAAISGHNDAVSTAPARQELLSVQEPITEIIAILVVVAAIIFVALKISR
jgi:hypothetical protein